MSPKRTLKSILLLGSALILVRVISARGVPLVVATNLEKIPMQIGEYRGVEDRFDASVYTELDADQHVYRHYRAPDGREVTLYIGYYGTAKGGRTPHNPYACLPGSGWGIARTGTVTLKPPYLDRPVDVRFIHAKKGNAVESILHWYQSSATRVLTSGLEQNLHRFVSRVFYNRNDGAFVRVSAVVPRERVVEADAWTRAFAQEVIALLPQYWPEEH